MNRHNLAPAGKPALPHILIITASRQAHHRFLRELTAAPSILGDHYVVVTMSLDEISIDADEPFTLILIDYDPLLSEHVVDMLRASAPQTPLLVVKHDDGQATAIRGLQTYEWTTAAQLRPKVTRILQGA